MIPTFSVSEEGKEYEEEGVDVGIQISDKGEIMTTL